MDTEKPLFETGTEKKQQSGENQEFKLFIKASQIDKETRGSCPVCQQWFMVAYLIAQKQDGVNFSVYTVQESSPPKEFEGWSKKFPVVLPVNCVNKKGSPIGGELCDNFDDLETFFEAINRDCPELKRHNIENSVAMSKIDKVYATFNKYLTGQPWERLERELRLLDKDMDNEFSFLIDDQLCFVDCHLLPRLQHIKVALKRIAGKNIPEDCKAIWRYLVEAYKQPAFMATMPSDQDITFHYSKKATGFPQVKNVTTQKFSYDTAIPESILNEKNGEGEAIEEQMQQQQEEVEAVVDNNGLEQAQDNGLQCEED